MAILYAACSKTKMFFCLKLENKLCLKISFYRPYGYFSVSHLSLCTMTSVGLLHVSVLYLLVKARTDTVYWNFSFLG